SRCHGFFSSSLACSRSARSIGLRVVPADFGESAKPSHCIDLKISGAQSTATPAAFQDQSLNVDWS
ncbi:hypothetical protein, partial [Mesorhizobium sp.]|uniref:hypothetical protein n=1 Tax=Mesorhizobium sp. TaxID=1871066 RepID=UPI0025C6AC30